MHFMSFGRLFLDIRRKRYIIKQNGRLYE